MRKILLSVIATVAVVSLASAQSRASRDIGMGRTMGWGWGVRAGINISNMTNTGSTDSKVGFTGGVFGDYKLTHAIDLSADVMYSSEGFRTRNAVDREGFLTHYLNVPIMVNYYFLPGFCVKAGVQPGFLLAARERVHVDGTTETFDVTSAMTTMDFGIPVGLAYIFKFGLIIDARYNFGLVNVIKADQGSNGNSVRNNFVSVTAGWRFR